MTYNYNSTECISFALDLFIGCCLMPCEQHCRAIDDYNKIMHLWMWFSEGLWVGVLIETTNNGHNCALTNHQRYDHSKQIVGII